MADAAPSTTLRARLTAIDWVRGLVMVLMTSDHASVVFYGSRVGADGVIMRGWDEPLAVEPFLHRWLSHLCAPTFVFLAGTSIALSAARRRTEGRGVAGDLAIRGLLLIGLEVFLSSPALAWPEGFWLMLQVLFAIGAGMLAMALLYRLPGPVCGLLGLAIVSGHEAVARLLTDGYASQPGLVSALTVTGGFPWPVAIVVYPALPWLGVMLLGYALGRHVVATGRLSERSLWGGGAAGLLVWFLVEWFDGYGNCGMLRVDGSWLRWLQSSKYPPCLGFVGLELGLMSWILALRLRYEALRGASSRSEGPLLLLGRTALCYYLLHMVLIFGLGMGPWLWFGLWDRSAVQGGLVWTWLWVAVTVIVLLPVCRAFLRAKRARPTSWLRWI